MTRYADVAIPSGVNRLFTYLVPSELQTLMQPGIRVTVPFGRKLNTGLVVDLPASSSLTSLKSIIDILDAEPVVSAELLRLCRWIAEYYSAPLGETLKAAIPHGFVSVSKRMVRAIAHHGDPKTLELRSRTPLRAQLLALLHERGPVSSSDLQKHTGLKNIHAVLNEMEKAGLLATEEVLAHALQKPKLRECLRLKAIGDDVLLTALEALPQRKKKARELLGTIQQMKQQGMDELLVLDLLKSAKASSRAFQEIKQVCGFTTEAKEVTRQQDYGIEQQTLQIELNPPQEKVLQSITSCITAGVHRTFLLHGVTGSGKTQVYIEAIRACLAHGKSAIVLVPEISLTPQIVRRFKSHFGDRALVMHSRMSAGERYDVWRLAHRGDCRIVIGPRSAVFAPLDNLGLIVVDEEHEATYKQYDSSPRYHARDVAIMRALDAQAPVVLGSATPSTETYHNALAGKFTLLELPDRVDQAVLPSVVIVDMAAERRRAYAALKDSLPEQERGKLRQFQSSSLSVLLKEKIAERLIRREGIILLQNRRGFAPFVECPACGYVEMCDNCQITLTFHLAKHHLRCHYCGLTRNMHDVCPECKSPDIRMRGVGTQRVEEQLSEIFPTARVLRMDLDTTTRKGAHDRMLKKFGNQEVDILLGTQMIAKGLDFPHVTLVGVISADTQMLLPDFRSAERTFQLLTQVAGRAGRSRLPGEVVIQTHQPGHYSLAHVVDHNYRAFYEEELASRTELTYPPFSRIILLEARGANEEQVRRVSETLGESLERAGGPFMLLGPAPAAIAKVKNQFRWHLIVKSPKERDPSGAQTRETVRRVLVDPKNQPPRDVHVIVDVDPVGVM
jgi:primosomal protein N' (replication factor Y) (superfamily II helicase)